MSLRGLRVMLVEDESQVALLVEAMLEDLGCELVDAAWRAVQAEALAHATRADVAILDVNLAGERVFPTAEVLRRRGVPVVFATGYGQDGVPALFDEAPVLAKPFRQAELAAALERAHALRRSA